MQVRPVQVAHHQEIERELLTRAGERLGPWVRLRGNDLAATASDTALLAVVAGSIGDPLGADMAAYVIAALTVLSAIVTWRLGHSLR